MKKIIVLLGFLLSLSAPAMAGKSANAGLVAKSSDPGLTFHEKHQHKLTDKQQQKLEKLEGKLKKRVAKRNRRKNRKQQDDGRLQLSRTAKLLSVVGLIAGAGFGLGSALLSGLAVSSAALAFSTVLYVLSSLAGLALTIGGIMGLVLWILERKSDNPSAEVLRNSKTAALTWAIPLVVSLLATISLYLVVFLTW